MGDWITVEGDAALGEGQVLAADLVDAEGVQNVDHFVPFSFATSEIARTFRRGDFLRFLRLRRIPYCPPGVNVSMSA